jgi:hypothetical protein
VAALIGVGSAQAVSIHVSYGRAGKVQLLKTQGYHAVNQNPFVIFPAHWIRRSPLAPRKRQYICTTEQIWEQVGYPYFNWIVTAKRPNDCAWTDPGYQSNIDKWAWQGVFGTAYHAKIVVTWAAQARGLAKATYDFNSVSDYQCVTSLCYIDVDQENKVAFIAFEF